MSLASLFPYLMLNMLQMLIHPSSGACDLFVELFHELYCSDTMCYVVVWLGWCGIRIHKIGVAASGTDHTIWGASFVIWSRLRKLAPQTV